MMEKGMGRSRLGRFAAVSVPAGVAAGALGFAMLTGSVGAVLSSTNGFLLETGNIETSGIKLTAAEANVAGGDQAAIYAETTESSADTKLDITTATINLPVVPDVHISIESTLGAGETVDLGDIVLNAKTLTTNGGASLGGLTVGVANSAAGFSTSTASTRDANGFALTASTGGVLRNLSAHSYALTLGSLDVDNLSLELVTGAFDPSNP